MASDSKRLELLHQQDKPRYDNVRDTEAALEEHLCQMSIVRFTLALFSRLGFGMRFDTTMGAND